MQFIGNDKRIQGSDSTKLLKRGVTGGAFYMVRIRLPKTTSATPEIERDKIIIRGFEEPAIESNPSFACIRSVSHTIKSSMKV
jgi:hypothetical protein